MNKAICLLNVFFLLITSESICFAKTVQTKSIKLKITNVQLFQEEDSSKVIIGFSMPYIGLPVLMSESDVVLFELNAVYEDKQNASFENQSLIESGEFIKYVRWYSSKNKTKFEIKRDYFTPVNFKKQINPPGLIVEFPKNYFLRKAKKIKTGLILHTVRTANKRGPIVANLLEVDLLHKNISLKVGMPSKKTIRAKETLLNIVKNEMAFAGINANFFDVTVGNPLGTLITGGDWVVGPIYDRIAIGFSDDKQIFIDRVMLEGNVNVSRGFRKKPFAMFQIDGLNTPVMIFKEVGIYTSIWGDELELPEDKVAVVVEKGCVKKKQTGTVLIPQGGYLLVSKNDYVIKLLKKKDCLDISWVNKPDWSNVVEAVSGGPYLIKGRKIFVDLQSQQFKFARKDIFAPRSAIGIGQDEKLYLITVDGSKNGYPVGLTLLELAEFLKKLEFKDAINLDGGGSTTLVVNGKIINKLFDNHQRKVSNGLLIFYTK